MNNNTFSQSYLFWTKIELYTENLVLIHLLLKEVFCKLF